MQNERENLYQPLTYTDYDISGNVFRAYYDADGKIVFVLDYTETPVKPNVLLVINPVGERKWDDILANDYGVDLEMVRPKKDNKYQKLDIEYVGLAQYDDLIQASKNNINLDVAVLGLVAFRNDAARRAAYERLGAAELTADRARETVEKTKETVTDLQVRIKELRTKLAAQRRDIGREPTKQSAAKILRTETQIDAATDKLARAKKRLQRAQRRLDVALEEIDVANNILNILDNDDVALPVVAEPTTDVTVVAEAVPVVPQTKPQELENIVFAPQINIINNNDNPEPKAEKMADEEVKPLFDKDPNILNDEIAFKPVDFGEKRPQGVLPEPSVDDDDLLPMPAPQGAVEPVVFAPVTDVPELAEYDNADVPEVAVEPLTFQPPFVEQTPEVHDVPVLDSITSVSEPEPQIDSELMSSIAPIEIPQVPEYATTNATSDVVARPFDDIEPAPIDTGMRPVSPISGDSGAALPPAPVADAVVTSRRPTVMYYVLLIILIVLSIFTLWLYQNKANKTVPELGIKTQQQEVAEIVDVATEEMPAVSETVAEPNTDAKEISVADVPELVSEQIIIQDVVPEPVPVVVPEPVQLEPVVMPESVPVTPVEETVPESVPDAPVIPEPTTAVIGPVVSPFLPEVEVSKKQPTEEEILARKPAYGVSQNEKMFVADEEYETDTSVADEDFAVMDTPIVRSTVAAQQEIEPATHQYVTQQVFEETEIQETCTDGNAPDANGCCAGEELADVDGEYLCCAIGTDECFPPMN